MELNDTDELFLAYVEEGYSLKNIAEKLGLTYGSARNLQSKLKDVIIDRARDELSLATLKAVRTAINSMDADASTEKGELKLKAAESIMDRTGLTKHTNVEVQIESENGLFILPAKIPVAPESASEE